MRSLSLSFQNRIVENAECKSAFATWCRVVALREKGRRALDAQRKHAGRLSVVGRPAFDLGDELFRVSWSGRSTDRRIPVRPIDVPCDFFPALLQPLSPFLRTARLRSQGRIGCLSAATMSNVVGDRTAPGLVSCTMYGSRPYPRFFIHAGLHRSRSTSIHQVDRQRHFESSLTATLNRIQLRCHKCSRRYTHPPMHSNHRFGNRILRPSREIPKFSITISSHYLLQRRAQICFYHKIEYLSLLLKYLLGNIISYAPSLYKFLRSFT